MKISKADKDRIAPTIYTSDTVLIIKALTFIFKNLQDKHLTHEAMTLFVRLVKRTHDLESI